MAIASTAAITGLWVDIVYDNGFPTSIKLSGISAIDRERNVVNVYHSGNYHVIRFNTEAEAVSLFNAIKAAIV